MRTPRARLGAFGVLAVLWLPLTGGLGLFARLSCSGLGCRATMRMAIRFPLPGMILLS